MNQLDMISDAIAKLEATVEAAAAPSAESARPLSEVSKVPQRRCTKKPSAQRVIAPSKPQVRKTSRCLKTTKAPRSKKAVLMGLISRKSGATMQAMMSATGWQAHSVRAGLSGLRKDGLGLERRSNRKGDTVYAIVEPGED